MLKLFCRLFSVSLVLLFAGCHTPWLGMPPLVCCTGPESTIIDVSIYSTDNWFIQYRPLGKEQEPWQKAEEDTDGEVPITGLTPGTRYEYRLRSGGQTLANGSFVTARPPGEPFTFALISDPHIYLRSFAPWEVKRFPLLKQTIKYYGSQDKALWIRRQERAYGRAMLPRVSRLISEKNPDFIINLGDIIDLHGLGFNAPIPPMQASTDPDWSQIGFTEYRRLLGPLGSNTTHFQVIGNWDGEKGCFTEEDRNRARQARFDWLPTPRTNAGPNRDYYSFRWGDGHFIILNVITYTKTEHTIHEQEGKGRATQFTLGKAQMDWLEQTLASSSAPFKFICIHHTVGGKAGNKTNSGYGRGGGQAAYVGDQAQVHELMKKYGVQIFFYGHDHVFTDMVVDGIHYTLPGSCGAPWKFTPKQTGYTRYWPDSGYALVKVEPEASTVTFINADKEVLHSYKVEKK